MARRLIAAVLAFLVGLWGNISAFFTDLINDYTFAVDAAVLGERLPNVKSNLNRYGGRFPENPIINDEYNPYAFVDYIQLMECTGGNAGRDLFRDPDDFTVTDDYDFEPLLRSCRGILKTGAKPLLKLGNVPAKLSQNNIAAAGADTGEFDVNIYPPDDYGAYYRYIRAVAQALVDEFGPDEVRSWRFGVMTEYENAGWFSVPGGDAAQTAQAYCKLYDYTVQALIDVLGEDVFVGAHSMTCSEGLFDEREFIRHCGVGKNYATGQTGSRLSYLAASYYENRPGDRVTTKSIPEIMKILRGTAESVGLNDLIYGVDEGRILRGIRSGRDDDQLNSRTVGYTYQAAFDARLVKQMFDCGMDYFSSWEYCSLPESHGNPTVSYHVASHAAAFEGARMAQVKTAKHGLIPKADVSAAAAYDEQTGTLRIMAYNYKNKLDYKTAAQVTLNVNAPQLADGEAKVTAYVIDDSCNWFDEWAAERESLGFTDDKCYWSPDDGCPIWADDAARQSYEALQERYAPFCRLAPQESNVTVSGGRFTLTVELAPHAVVFFEVTQ